MALESKVQQRHTSYLTIKMFRRWAFALALVVVAAGALTTQVLVKKQQEGLITSVMARLDVQASGRAELVRLWVDNLFATGRNITNSDLMRLYTTEMRAVKEGKQKKEISASLKAQRPYMDYMINEFAKQHDLISAHLIGASGTKFLNTTGALDITPNQATAVKQASQTGQKIILPIRSLGGELVVDVLRPIFPLEESLTEEEVVGVLLTTHNVSTAINRVLEPNPLDRAGERFALTQSADGQKLSGVGDYGLAEITPTLPQLAEVIEAQIATNSPTDDALVYITSHRIDNTPFIILGEFEVKKISALFSAVKRSIYASVTIGVLLILMGLMAMLWVLLSRYSKQRQRLQEQTMDVMVRAIEIRDPYLAGHHQRVARLALQVGREMKLSVFERSTLFYAAHLSGIGKIFVAKEILTKPGKLTKAERTKLEKHVDHAGEVLKGVQFDLPVEPVIQQMHERLDGTGYPNKLKSPRINPLSRVLGVCDVFCALTAPRSYRDSMTAKEALIELDKEQNRYDARVVQALKKVVLSQK